jgi:hypothetical protein
MVGGFVVRSSRGGVALDDNLGGPRHPFRDRLTRKKRGKKTSVIQIRIITRTTPKSVKAKAGVIMSAQCGCLSSDKFAKMIIRGL